MKFRNCFGRRSNPRREEAQEESMNSVVDLAAGDSADSRPCPLTKTSALSQDDHITTVTSVTYGA